VIALPRNGNRIRATRGMAPTGSRAVASLVFWVNELRRSAALCRGGANDGRGGVRGTHVLPVDVDSRPNLEGDEHA